MRKGLFIPVFLVLFSLVITGCLSKNQLLSPEPQILPVTDGNAGYVPNQLLVRFKPDADVQGILAAIGGGVVQYYEQIDYWLISYKGKNNVREIRDTLWQTGQVYFAEPNYIAEAGGTPDDPYISRQWGLEQINAAGGWESVTGSADIVVAILDTGIDHTHPDLVSKVVDGYDVFSRKHGKSGDINGHGTNVAGIVGAEANNGIGIAGIAWNARLMPVKVLNDYGNGAYSDIITGILWAVGNGARIINLSTGTPGYSRALQSAVDYALERNVVVVAAAGNESRVNNNFFPAAFPGVISVGAVRPDNTAAPFSTKGNHLFISAPGEQVYSTKPGGDYAYVNGTSFSAPFVSGAVALLLSKFEDMTVNEVRSQLMQAGSNKEWNQETGWGTFDLGELLKERRPNRYGSIHIEVIDSRGQALPGAYLHLFDQNDRSIASMIAEESGRACFWSLLAGEYKIYGEYNNRTAEKTLSVTAGHNTVEELVIEMPDYISYTDFYENAESETALVIPEGNWGKTTESSKSPDHSWTDSPDGNYGFDWDYSLTTVPISLAGSVNPYLTFWHCYEIEYYFDMAYVQISTDYGLTWHKIAEYTGNNPEWHQEKISLVDYLAYEIIAIRFRIKTDGNIVDKGWYIDDIAIIEIDED